MNDNGHFDRWLTSNIPEGYTSVGGAVLSKLISNTTTFSSLYSCVVTSSGTSEYEGLSYSIPRKDISNQEWFSIGAMVWKPTGFVGNIVIKANFDGTVRTHTIDSSEYPDEVWFRIGNAFKRHSPIYGASNTIISIGMDGSPEVGKYFIVDAIEISRGLQSFSNGSRKSNQHDNFYIRDSKVTYDTAVPTSGDWLQGDRIYNSTPTTDANNMVLDHWVCITTGSPGTWVPQYISTVSPAT